MLRNYSRTAIASGGTVSTVANGQGMRLAGVFADSNFSGTSVSLLVSGPNNLSGRASSFSGGTFTATLAASGFAAIPNDIGAAIEFVQFVSSTTQGSTPSTLTAVFIST